MDKELIKIDKFINGFLEFSIDRLGSITRYNTRRFIRPQTVMQHIGSTALIAMLISDYLNEIGVKNNSEKTLRMAIVHDIEEVISGDIPHELKYDVPHSARLRSTLNELSAYTLSKTLDLIGDSHLKGEYRKLLDEEKDMATIEAKIVKAADYIDVVIYARLESKIGNKTMKKEEARALELYKKILKKIFTSGGKRLSKKRVG
jgi:5'-deoxynucleotidase YfbR-like HD superfamily hydrolase